jgi:hypothetical protein
MAAGAAIPWPLIAQIGAGVGASALGAWGRSRVSNQDVLDTLKGYYGNLLKTAERGIPYDLGWAAWQRARAMMPFNPAVFWLLGPNPMAQIFYALLSPRL